METKKSIPDISVRYGVILHKEVLLTSQVSSTSSTALIGLIF